jgi:hypothetical protein
LKESPPLNAEEAGVITDPNHKHFQGFDNVGIIEYSSYKSIVAIGDTESNGLDPNIHQIVQYCFKVLLAGEGGVQSYIKPDYS